MRPLPLLALTLALLSACAHLAAGPSPSREAQLRAAALELMAVCWPTVGHSGESVRLTFTREGGALRDVQFEVAQGASNAVGRCAAHIAWRFPWEGRFPETLEVLPPLARPSGWTQLAHLALLASGTYPPERGLTHPAPLVRACLTAGEVRRRVKYRVQPQPVRVTPYVEAVVGGVVGTEPTPPLSDAERCVVAVLAAAVYPSTAVLELDLDDPRMAPEPAARQEVAHYFPAPELARGILDPGSVQPALLAIQADVAGCWERALRRRAGLHGGRSLRLRVAQEGTVAHAVVVPNASSALEDAADYLLDVCLVAAVGKARLPPPNGGPADVVYSWIFEHR